MLIKRFLVRPQHLLDLTMKPQMQQQKVQHFARLRLNRSKVLVLKVVAAVLKALEALQVVAAIMAISYIHHHQKAERFRHSNQNRPHRRCAFKKKFAKKMLTIVMNLKWLSDYIL